MREIWIYGAIAAERKRQEELLASGKFSWTCASPEISDERRLSVLMEEVGEVANDINEQNHDPQWREKMAVELIQVAAVCVAWLEALE